MWTTSIERCFNISFTRLNSGWYHISYHNSICNFSRGGRGEVPSPVDSRKLPWFKLKKIWGHLLKKMTKLEQFSFGLEELYDIFYFSNIAIFIVFGSCFKIPALGPILGQYLFSFICQIDTYFFAVQQSSCTTILSCVHYYIRWCALLY